MNSNNAALNLQQANFNNVMGKQATKASHNSFLCGNGSSHASIICW